MMQLLSVNVGHEQAIQYAKESGVTGIYKIPTDAPIAITKLGLTGDTISDTENHGGVDQAVYVYGSADYAWWAEALGRLLAPGTFGENLTISDLESASLNIGDRLQVGAVLLEISAPRIPCVTLATRMGDPMFVKRFREAERPGVYCRVIDTGAVTVGDPVSLIAYTGATVSVIENFRAFYDKETPEATIRRLLAAPIAIRDRQDNEKRLQAFSTPPR